MEQLTKVSLKNAIEVIRYWSGSQASSAIRNVDTLYYRIKSKSYALTSAYVTDGDTLNGNESKTVTSIVGLTKEEVLEWLSVYDAAATEETLQKITNDAISARAKSSQSVKRAKSADETGKVRRPRAKSEEAKLSKHVAINVTESEYAAIFAASKEKGVTTSQFIRDCISKALSVSDT